jgi:hypothetical protein
MIFAEPLHEKIVRAKGKASGKIVSGKSVGLWEPRCNSARELAQSKPLAPVWWSAGALPGVDWLNF